MDLSNCRTLIYAFLPIKIVSYLVSMHQTSPKYNENKLINFFLIFTDFFSKYLQ